MKSEALKFSIITPSLNQGRFIEDTIQSVMNQNYKNFEHIIIDGGSTDNTLEILKKYPHLKWVSEEDSGPANAINKGFKNANGDIYAWINSDDYYESNIFRTVATYFSERINFFYGNITFVYPEEGRYDKLKIRPYTIEDLIHNSADSIRQAGIFFSKDLFLNVNGLDESLKLVFDYDLFIKMLRIGNQIYIDKNIAYQRMYKETLTKRNLRQQAAEIYKVSRRYGAKLNDVIMLKSVIRKILFPKMF